MQLIGETVQHKVFGRGVVTDCRADVLTVRFSDSTQKEFIYPDAFQQHFLTMDSKTGCREVADMQKPVDKHCNYSAEENGMVIIKHNDFIYYH